MCCCIFVTEIIKTKIMKTTIQKKAFTTNLKSIGRISFLIAAFVLTLGNTTITKGGNMIITTGANITVARGGDMTVTSGGNTTVTTGGNTTVTTGGNTTVTTGGNTTITTGGNTTVTSGGNITVTTGGNITITTGGNTKIVLQGNIISIEDTIINVGKTETTTTGMIESGPKTGIQMNAYPNPFTYITNIHYIITEKANVELSVYDMLGNKVAVLENEIKSSGEYQTELKAENLSPGIYMFLLNVDGRTSTTKVVLSK